MNRLTLRNFPPRRFPIRKSVNRLNTLFWFLLIALALSSDRSVDGGDPTDGTASLKTENILLITMDGLRWQELFSGGDESLMNKEFGGVKGLEQLRDRFWRSDARERRSALMPFFWSTIATQGKVYGDPEHGSVSRVENPHWFSYPGYNEILTGIADPKIDSNAKSPNPHVTVLEWLHGHAPFHGQVSAFCSWDVFPFIINAERSGIPVNAGWQPLDPNGNDPELGALDRFADEIPHYWDNVRYDYFTYRGALRALKRDQPRVLYVALGETDDWAHAGRYDLYLDAAFRNDQYIKQLWETMQQMPQYAGKTSLVLTTDHGRGDTRIGWKSHGDDHPGSDVMWIAVMGPDTPSGFATNVAVTQSQVAATVAQLLGLDYHREISASAPPLPGAVSPAK